MAGVLFAVGLSHKLPKLYMKCQIYFVKNPHTGIKPEGRRTGGRREKHTGTGDCIKTLQVKATFMYQGLLVLRYRYR